MHLYFCRKDYPPSKRLWSLSLLIPAMMPSAGCSPRTAYLCIPFFADGFFLPSGVFLNCGFILPGGNGPPDLLLFDPQALLEQVVRYYHV